MDIESLVARGLQILIALGGAYLLATWFVLAVWTFRDAESRSRNVVTQVFSTLLVVLFWVPGWLLYRLLRPAETLDQAYQRSLEEEYLLQDLQEMPLCPSCHHFINDEWRICPHCNTQLREDCDSCGKLIDLQWDICPYCANPHSHEHEEHEVTIEDDRWIDPASIEKRLRDEERRRARSETRALPAATAETTLGTEALAGPVVRQGLPTNGSENGVDRSEPEVIAQPARSVDAMPDLSRLREPGEPEVAEDEQEVTTVPDRFRVQ